MTYVRRVLLVLATLSANGCSSDDQQRARSNLQNAVRKRRTLRQRRPMLDRQRRVHVARWRLQRPLHGATPRWGTNTLCSIDSGECMLPGGGCKDAYTVQLPNGDEQSCTGHSCIADGQCAEACSHDSQCDPAYACQSGRCKERPGSKSDAGAHADGGADDQGGSSDADCSCRAAGLRHASNKSGRALALAALVLGINVDWRRRRAAVRRDAGTGAPTL